ncbi:MULTISPECIES: hypothetical protein [unclassified Streptomyces]|nr:hypothetical protein [Streptomyces sp. CB01580]
MITFWSSDREPIALLVRTCYMADGQGRVVRAAATTRTEVTGK